MSPLTIDGRGIRAGALLAALAAAAFAPKVARSEPARPTVGVARDGSNGYPSQAPVAGWLKEIEGRQAKVRSLTASYEIQSTPRGRMDPLVETGRVKFRFASEPNRPPLERWEGKGDSGTVLRIVRDGTVYERVNDKLDRWAVTHPTRIGPSLLHYPCLPEACAARFFVWYDPEFEAGTSGPVAGRPFPTALGLEPRPGLDVNPRVQRVYVALDAETALAYKIRLNETSGAMRIVELFDLKPNAEVSDADFAAPADPGGAPAAKPAANDAK